VTLPRPLVVTVLAGASFLSACSSSHGAPQALPTTTTSPLERAQAVKLASLKDFCGRVQDLTNATAEVGTVTKLDQVRAQMTAATKLADQAVTEGTPKGSNTYLALLALDTDLRVVNTWIQTQATQAQLDDNTQPTQVHLHFVDLGVQFRALNAWSSPNCEAFSGGDDS
jgi:hypothetical protein